MVMTTISNNEKSINIKFTENIIFHNGNYFANLPIISCNTQADAEYIQIRVNEFVNNLCHEVLEK